MARASCTAAAAAAAAAAIPAITYDLDLTLVSAKHLKNVNWRSGPLAAYAVVWLHPDHKLSTVPDDAGDTSPVWNHRFTLPLPTSAPADSLLSLDVFHSSSPNPLVASLRRPLRSLLDPAPAPAPAGVGVGASAALKTLDLLRPSGRPHGKIRLKIALRVRLPPPLPPPPPAGYYYGHHLPPPPRPAYGGFPDSYPGGYYPSPGTYFLHSPPPLPPSSYYGGPSAPIDYGAGVRSYYDNSQSRGAKMRQSGGSAPFADGGLAGSMGALAIGEGVKYGGERVGGKVGADFSARDDFSDFRGDY